MSRSVVVLLASALVLAGCAGNPAPLPTLVPSLTPAPEDSVTSEPATPEPATLEPSQTPSPENSATSEPASPSPDLSATPTRRVSPTPAPSATLTDVPTITPFPSEAPPRLSPSPTFLPSLLTPTDLPITPSPTVAVGQRGGALAAYQEANAQASTAHPNLRLFFISGSPQRGWTIGYRDPADPNRQALYQVGTDGTVQPLDVLSPQASEPFDPATVRVDSSALQPLVADFASGRETLIYTLTLTDGRLLWEVRNLEQNASRLFDAISGEQLP